MTAAQARQVLQANAVLDFVAGLLLLSGTWDGLWDALDLPQGRPALFMQVGGAALLGFAYLLRWPEPVRRKVSGSNLAPWIRNRPL